jgi:glutamyl-tRNA reductase
MRLSVTGVNHKTAPVEVRELLAFDQRQLPTALAELRRRAEMSEAVILSTCNRVEIMATTDKDCDPQAAVMNFLADAKQINLSQIQPHLYHYEDREAIRHIFRVAASLDSMVIGEPQILGQLKAAYAEAKTHGAVSGFLETVLTRAFAVAKRVRSETDIGRNAVSVGYVAVELAKEIFGALAGRKVLLVGAGKMSELAARYLHRSGAQQIFVTNRTHDRAVELASLFGGFTVQYNLFVDKLPEVDIVIASSGAPHYILCKEDMKRVIEARRNRPMFLIDIAVPRNIEPAVNDLDNVFLYDIDDLQKVVDANRQGRVREASQAEAIISHEVERLVVRLKAREVAPTIIKLQQQLEALRAAEVARMRGKFGSLTPEQEEALAVLTRSLMSKIAHAPIAELRKHAGRSDGMHTIDVIRRIFRLDEEE